MGGEQGRGDPQVPDYAGKDSGLSGGPGGHARERLDELLRQRLPVTDDDAEADATTADAVSTDDATTADATEEDADAGEQDELADGTTDGEPADAGEDRPQERGARP